MIGSMQILIVQTSTNPNNNVTEVHKKQIHEVLADAVIEQTTPDSNDFLELLAQAEVVLTQNLAVISLKNAPKLRWIHLTSAGVNNLTEELRGSEVVITNSSGVHPVPISEHVLGLMLMLSRNLHGAYRSQLEKKWARGDGLLPISELSGKTVCIVGLGAIG